MKRVTILALGVMVASASHATLVAKWNFNTLVAGTNGSVAPSNAMVTSYAADGGTGTLTLAGITSRGGTASPWGITNFGGSTLNANGGDAAGQALAIETGISTTAGVNNNGTVTFAVSLAGLADPIFSFASRNTATGFNNNTFAYSTDGTNFTTFGSTYAMTTTFAAYTFDMTGVSALTNASTAYFRITLLNGTTTSGTGNNRLDNVQINATPAVPEPATFAALGLGAVAVLRRRNRKA